jgi:hypothetical protein
VEHHTSTCFGARLRGTADGNLSRVVVKKERPTLTLRDLLARWSPGAAVVSASQPEPVLHTLNVVGVVHDETAARRALGVLEPIEHGDTKVALVTYRSRLNRLAASTRAAPPGERRGNGSRGRATGGAAIGAVIGVLAGGGVMGVLQYSPAAMAVVGLLCGVVFGVLGALMSAAVHQPVTMHHAAGGPDTTSTMIALLTDDQHEAVDALERLRESATAREVRVVDSAGIPRPIG